MLISVDKSQENCIDKSNNNMLINDVLVYLKMFDIISSIEYSSFTVNHNFPDEFYEIYSKQKGVPETKNDLIELGIHSMYAGLITCHSQLDFDMPVASYTDDHINAIKQMYANTDFEEIIPERYKTVGWGEFATLI